MEKERKHQVTVRIKPGLYEKIKTVAEIEERSVPQQILFDIEGVLKRKTIPIKQQTKIYNFSEYRQ